MKHPVRARIYGYVTFGNSPLKRPCPKCEALAGQPCWNLRRKLYPAAQKAFHEERKAKRSSKKIDDNP